MMSSFTILLFSIALGCHVKLHGSGGAGMIVDAFSVTTNRRSRSVFPSTSLKATWSNGQAIKEYQDFLASGKQEIMLENDSASVIVTSLKKYHTDTSANVVNALYNFGGTDDVVLIMDVKEESDGSISEVALPSLPDSLAGEVAYPIYIALPPNQLELFIMSLTDEWKPRISDFVFLSGGVCGVIEPILKRAGFARDEMTQLLMGGFSVPTPPEKPEDLSFQFGTTSGGEEKWTGESAACGKWAGAVKERLEVNGIKCKVGFYRDWRRMMWERAAFDAVFNLIGAVREEPTTIKDVALYYEKEVSEMLWEITSSLRGMLAVTLLYGFEDRLLSFAESDSNAKPCEVTDAMYPYMFCQPLDQGKMVASYLNFAKDERGLLQTVPVPRVSEKISAMRQGNLRANGVV